MSNDGAKLSDTQHAFRGLRLVGSARLFSQCVTWSLTIITVRLLQPGDFGLVATSGLFTVLASMVTEGGLSDILIFRHDLSGRVHGAAVVGGIVVSSVIAAAIMLAAPAGAAFFRNPALTAVLRVAALQLPLSAIAIVPFALLSKEMLYGRVAVIQSSVSVIQGIATLTMAYKGEAYWSLIYGTLLGSALRACALWFALKKRPPINWHLGELRPILGDSAHMVGQRLIYFFIADFDVFLVGRMSGAVALGPYSLAKALSHAALDQISGIVNQIALPSFAAKAGDREAQLGALKAVIAAASTVVFPLFWFAGVISRVAFPLIFGPRWNDLVFPFAAFTLLLPLRTIYALLGSAVLGTGKTSIGFKIMVVWASIMMPVLFVGALFGPNAVAVAWVVGFPFVFMYAMLSISRHFEISLREILRPLFMPAVCTAATAATVEIFALSVGSLLPPLVLLVIEILLAGGLYWMLIARFGRSQYDQTMRMGWQLIGR